MRLRIEGLGMKVIERELTRFEDAAMDLSPAWVQVGQLIAEMNAETFKRGQAGGWAALSPAYAAAKARAGYGEKPILVRTEQLFRHLTSEMDVQEVGPQSAAFGTRVADYGRYHQTGTPRMPARPPLVFSEADKRAIVKVIQRHVIEHRGVGGVAVRGAA